MERERGHNAAAFDLLLRVVEENPKEAAAHFLLSQYYYALKDKARALSSLEKAAALEPDNYNFIETLAQHYIAAGQYDEAIKAYERLSQIDHSNEEVVYVLANLYTETEAYDDAIKAYERMEELEGKSEEISRAKTRVLLSMGDRDGAAAEAKALADQYPNDPDFLCVYATMLLNSDRTDEGLALMDSILCMDPDNKNVQLSLRHYHYSTGDSIARDSITLKALGNKAMDDENRVDILRQEIALNESKGGDSLWVIRCFDVATEAEQEPGDICFLYASYMQLKHMPQELLTQMLEKTLSRAPSNASARFQLLSQAYKNEDMDKAIALCADARQYSPEEMVFYYYQGMAYYKKDMLDQALEAFRSGISVITPKSDTEIVSDFYAIMGDILHQKGLAREAYEAYDSCLAWKADNLGCLNNYAYFLSEEDERLDEAEQMSHKTIKENPTSSTYLDTYAWILFKQERYAEANIYIEQALQNDSTLSSVIIDHAGDIAAMNGNMEEAVSLWQQALLLDPNNKLLQRKIKKKKYLKE